MGKERLMFLLRNTKIDDFKDVYKGGFKVTNDIKKFKIKNLEGGKFRRPEVAGATMYGAQEEQKYIVNVRNANIQKDMTRYAMELLHIGYNCHKKHFILDIGCGCGVSSSVMESAGHFVIGVDISRNLLTHGRSQNTLNDFITTDVTKGLVFRQGSFCFAISISVLQWFINEISLFRIFTTLRDALSVHGKAVFQFYPRSCRDVDLTLQCAEHYFQGCLISDYPSENRGKKLFLYLVNKGSK